MQDDVLVRLCMHCKKIYGCTIFATGESSRCETCGKIDTCKFHSFNLSETKECEACLLQKECDRVMCANGNWFDCMTCPEERSCQNIQKARIGMNQVSHGYCTMDCMLTQNPYIRPNSSKSA